MPNRASNSLTIALTCVMAVLLCLAQTASALAAKSPGKTASGIFFGESNIYTGEILPESLQPQWEIAPATTATASGRQVWLSADPIGEEGGINLYGYVGGNPMNAIDPLGLYIGAPGGEVWHPMAREGTAEQRKKWGDRAAMTAAAICAGSAAPGAVAAVASRYPGLFIGGVAALDETGVLATAGFFGGAKYTAKVLSDMRRADLHGFPEAVRAFECNGTVSKLIGGDGKVREILRIPGEYKDKKGFFEFIKEADGAINHRFFREN